MESNCCIYKITSPTGKIYIGQTVDWNRRKKEYLRGKSKSQVKLNRSFLKHGIENHSFEVIKYCSSVYLDKLECEYIELYDSINNGLNAKGGGLGGYMPEEVRIKISRKHKNKIIKEETKEKLRKFKGSNHHGYGKKHLLCTIYKMKLAGKNRKHTEETKRKLSDIQLNSNLKAKPVIDINSGVFYNSPREVSELYNINLTTLRCWLNGSLKNKTQFFYC